MVPFRARYIRERIMAGLAWGLLLVLLPGCDHGSPATQNAAPVVTNPAPLRVLVLDDPPLAAAIDQQWKMQSDAGITVQQRASSEIGEFKRLGCDVVIYPSALLGDLAERRLIVPLDANTLARSEYDSADVFDLQGQETSWGRHSYGVSFGSPQLVLLYRADWFQKLGVQPPRSWAEYQSLVERLAREPRESWTEPSAANATNAASGPDSGGAGGSADTEATPGWFATAEPLGPDWGGLVLLARAASYARHASHYSTLFELESMDPLIAGPPFERALGELVAAAKFGPQDAITMSPAEALRRFRSGRCAVALCWPTTTGSASEALANSPTTVGFAELPASAEVYDFDAKRWETRPTAEDPQVPLLAIAGRVGSVTRETSNLAASLNLLGILAGPELAGSISPASEHTTLCRVSQANAGAKWLPAELGADAASAYADLVSRTQTRRSWLFAIRIPGRHEYLAALDEAVRQSVAGTHTPAEALGAAAQRWTEITNRRGIDAQRTAYRRNLGLD